MQPHRRVLWQSLALLGGGISGQQSVPASRAQDLPGALRGRVFGEVRAANGQSWAAAEVVLVSRPIPADPDAGTEDRVLATCDGLGRFAAEILRGRPYTAWAWGAAAAEERRATRVLEHVFVQRPVVLEESRVLRRRSVQLTQRERWAAHAPFTLRVIDQTGNRQVSWHPVDEEGRVTLPFLVGAVAELEVHGTQPCLYPILDRTLESTAAGVEIELPEAVRATCWARDADSGRPCPGATVFGRLGEAMYPVGVTDAAGKLGLDLWRTPDPSATPRWLVVSLDHTVGLCAPTRGGPFDTSAVPKEAGPGDLWSNLQVGGALHARVLGLLGRPLAGVQVWCAGSALHKPSRSSDMCGGWRRTVTADADGGLVLPGLLPRDQACAHLVLREQDYEAVPAPWRQGLVPVVFAPLSGQRGTGTRDDPVVVDLCRMCPLDLAVFDAQRTPAADAELSFGTLPSSAFGPWDRDDAVADPRGRLRILVPGRQVMVLRATKDLALLIRAFETSAGHRDAAPAAVRFTLPSPAAIHGQLLLPGGGPATGRTVFPTFGTNNRPAEWNYETQDAAVLEHARGNAVRVFLPSKNGDLLALTDLIGRQFPTDAEGRFVIPMPPVAMPELLLFAGTLGVRAFHESRRVEWSGETVRDLVWTLR